MVMTPASLRRLVASREDPTLEGMLDGREVGPIEVPADISRRCKVGWSIPGVVGRVGRRWRIIEAWNVYPG
jgi:hypothetical protein